MDTRRAAMDIQRAQRMIARAMGGEKQQERVVRPISHRRERADRRRAVPPVPTDTPLATRPLRD